MGLFGDSRPEDVEGSDWVDWGECTYLLLVVIFFHYFSSLNNFTGFLPILLVAFSGSKKVLVSRCSESSAWSYVHSLISVQFIWVFLIVLWLMCALAYFLNECIDHECCSFFHDGAVYFPVGKISTAYISKLICSIKYFLQAKQCVEVSVLLIYILPLLSIHVLAFTDHHDWIVKWCQLSGSVFSTRRIICNSKVK